MTDVLHLDAGLAAQGWGYCAVGANGAHPAYPRHSRQKVCNVLWVDGHGSAVLAPGAPDTLYNPEVFGKHTGGGPIPPDTKWDRK